MSILFMLSGPRLMSLKGKPFMIKYQPFTLTATLWRLFKQVNYVQRIASPNEMSVSS